MDNFAQRLIQLIQEFVLKCRTSLIISRLYKILSVDVFAKALGFILLPVYLQMMSQEEFGLYGYLLSIITAFSLFLNLGLYVAQIKLFSDYEGNERGSMIFTINVLLSFFLCIIIVVIYLLELDYSIVSFMFSNQLNYVDYRMFVFFSIVTSIFWLMVHSYFLASENITLIQLNTIAKVILINVLVIYYLYFNQSDAVLIRLKYTVVSQLLLLFIFSTFLIKRMYPKFRWDIAYRALIIGIPIMFSAIFGMLYSLADRFILEKYVGFEIIAIYNLGFTIASVITVLSTSFMTVYGPIFYKQKNPALNFENVRNLLKVAIPLCISIGAGLILVSWLMINYNIIDRDYNAVISLLPFLIVATIIQSVNHIYMLFMTYFEATYIIFLINVVSNIGNVILNIILIPRFGMYGAAFATVVTNAIAYQFFFYSCKKRVRLAVSIDQ